MKKFVKQTIPRWYRHSYSTYQLYQSESGMTIAEIVKNKRSPSYDVYRHTSNSIGYGMYSQYIKSCDSLNEAKEEILKLNLVQYKVCGTILFLTEFEIDILDVILARLENKVCSVINYKVKCVKTRESNKGLTVVISVIDGFYYTVYMETGKVIDSRTNMIDTNLYMY